MLPREKKMKEHLLDLLRDEAAGRLAQWGEAKFRAGQVLDWIYSKRVFDFAAMSNLPATLRTQLDEAFDCRLPHIEREVGSGETRKFLFTLADGELIEAVLLAAHEGDDGAQSGRRTLCVSSQAGCAYGCGFCATGQGGWRRDLQANEIVGQVLAVEQAVRERVDNVVFMGMGEPFANYDNVMRAIGILNALVGIGARHITVSTCGLSLQIRSFAEQPLQLRLAVSLHGMSDTVRGRMMPVNKKYPVAEVLDACAYFAQRKKQSLTFEYILVANVNDDAAQAAALADCAGRLGAKVNLIPYNTVEGLDWQRPSESTMQKFLATLRRSGISVTLRREKGGDIAAACGQLRGRSGA